jgi:hypothetical protein
MTRDDIHICISSLLKYKIYLYLYDSIKRHLYYDTVKFKIQIYIWTMLLNIALEGIVG